jgi:hypothetical protein
MTTRLFAYNTGSQIPGTDQIGDLAIGVVDLDYSQDPGGVKWWMGPDEDLGYVIAKPIPPNTQPTEISGVTASVGFDRSTDLTEATFVDLANIVFPNSPYPFTTGDEVKIFLNDNGYWTSWEYTPSAMTTPTPTPSPTPTPTPTFNVIPATATPTTTPTATPSTTSTPTPTPTTGGGTTIDLGSVNCRIVGSCNDNGTCAVRYNINFANGRPSATQVYIELFGSNTASVSIHNDLGNNTDCYLDYSETSGSQSANFRLVLKSFPSNTEICRSGDLTLSHNYNGQPWNMVSVC